MTVFIVVPKQGEPYGIEAYTMEMNGAAIVFKRPDEKTATAIVALDSVRHVYDRADPIIENPGS